MQIKIVEENGVVSLLTDKVNGSQFNPNVATRMFKYRDDGYSIKVPSKSVLHKLNNYCRANYREFFKSGCESA